MHPIRSLRQVSTGHVIYIYFLLALLQTLYTQLLSLIYPFKKRAANRVHEASAR